jgi:outer membrane biosynthesis protein TonB
MELLAILKRVIPFFLGLVVGLVPTFIFSPASAEVSPVVVENSVKYGKYCDSSRKKSKSSRAYRSSVETPLAIESKPRPGYTDVARQENTQGTIKLKIEFLSDGTIGAIEPLSELPNGLTEQAIEAAKKIRFRPAAVDGTAVDSTKLIEYTFSLY